jgi:hypothetical protein
MLFANLNGPKAEAKPGAKGSCPLCERSVFSKCGEVNIWHWAHHKGESCDSWYEPETEWHRNWKLAFGKENCEVVINQADGRHLADIRTIGEVVIELQNSPIQKSIIRERESFYGERMMWILNGKPFEENFLITKSPFFEDEEYNRLHNPLARQNGIVQNTPSDEYQFSWSWCRKSWNEVQRNVFIDFGNENLFWVKQGMGTKCGYGKQITKEKFLTKYGGNLELLGTLIDTFEGNNTADNRATAI